MEALNSIKKTLVCGKKSFPWKKLLINKIRIGNLMSKVIKSYRIISKIYLQRIHYSKIISNCAKDYSHSLKMMIILMNAQNKKPLKI